MIETVERTVLTDEDRAVIAAVQPALVLQGEQLSAKSGAPCDIDDAHDNLDVTFAMILTLMVDAIERGRDDRDKMAASVIIETLMLVASIGE